MGTGHVHFVGAGPGNPDLLTVRADRLLQQADHVLYDALVGPDVLKRIAPAAKRTCVGKRAGCASMAQSEINRRLVRAGREDSVVVRLKGGDPSLFGRLDEEMVALRQAGLTYDICPGVTAAIAASASLGIPLTKRGSVRGVHFMTTSLENRESEPIDWVPLADGTRTLVFYMARSRCRGILRKLLDSGLRPDMPVALVSNVSLPDETVTHLAASQVSDWEGARNSGPLLLLIGDVVTERITDQLDGAPVLAHGTG